MLEHKTVQQEDAIEHLFCIPFVALERVAMSDEILSFLVDSVIQDEAASLHENEAKKRLSERIKICFSYTMDEKTKLFLLFLCEGIINRCIMYLTYYQYVSRRKKIKHFLFPESITNIFADKFPSNSDLDKLWENVRVEKTRRGAGSNNLLDYQTALHSLLK